MRKSYPLINTHLKGRRVPQRRKRVRKESTWLRIGVVIVLLIVFLCLFILAYVSWDVRNVTSVSTQTGIGVYWDYGCTRSVQEINWDTLFPGAKKNVTVFIRNQLQNAIYLMLNTSDWNPQSAFNYMILSWDYQGNALNPRSVVKVNLILAVKPTITGITNFSFNIIIGEALPKSVDINHDGKVDMHDISAVASRFGARMGQPTYDSALDINSDATVDMIDVSLVAKNFGRLM